MPVLGDELDGLTFLTLPPWTYVAYKLVNGATIMWHNNCLERAMQLGPNTASALRSKPLFSVESTLEHEGCEFWDCGLRKPSA